jgi:ketosteroid isomerase-like protein
MNDILRHRLLDVYEAFYGGRIDDALAHYADDIRYVCYAPVSLFPELGFRQGKAQLAETMKLLHRRFHRMKFTVPRMLAGEHEVASVLDVRLQLRGSERLVQLYVANFIRFKDGQIVDHRTFLDAFDAVEQISGEEIDFKLACPEIRAMS